MRPDPDTGQRPDRLFINAAITTMAQARYNTIEKAALAVKEGRILWIRPMADLEGFYGLGKDRILDCSGKYILPGFVDCHTHLVWAGSRSNEFEMRLKGKSYEEISAMGGGIFSTVEACRAADEDRLFDISAKRVAHLMAQGITCLEIKSGYGLDTETELKLLRVIQRLNQAFPLDIQATFLGAHALPKEYSGRSQDYIDLVTNQMLPRVKDQGIARAVDVFCERVGFSLKETEQVFKAAVDLGFKIKLHAEQLSDSGGAGLAAGYNALSCDHLEYLSDAGARAMAAHNVTAVLLPGAFYYLKERQMPPMDLFRALAIPMALATDLNPGTSPVFSMTQVLNMGCLLFGMTCEEAIAGATIQGARALGLEASKGSLEPGKDADLTIWDMERPADLCYLSGRLVPETLVISGRIIETDQNS